MATKKGMKAVNYGFDDMAQGGLPDDFDGQIVKAVWAPTNYDGKLDHFVLSAQLTYRPDPDSGIAEFTQIYSAGDLDFFVPSKDGVEPVDIENGEGEDLEGYFVVPVGERSKLNNSSNFAFFMKKLQEAEFTGHQGNPSLEVLEGIYGHFNQIEQPKRSGIVVDDTSKRAKTVLCLTELKDAPKATKATAKAAPPKAKAKAAPVEEPEEESGEETIESRVSSVIVEALAEAEDNTLAKTKLVTLVVKAFSGADKAKAVKLVSDEKFLLNGEGFTFDKKSGAVSLG